MNKLPLLAVCILATACHRATPAQTNTAAAEKNDTELQFVSVAALPETTPDDNAARFTPAAYKCIVRHTGSTAKPK